MQVRRLFNLSSSRSRVGSSHGVSDSNSGDKIMLEVNLMFAQILPLRKRSYVVAYIDPNHKVTSRVDSTANFTWNDKFVMSIDNSLISNRPNACLIFEIYRARSGKLKKDKKIGCAHVLVQNLITGDSSGRKCIGINILHTESDNRTTRCIAFKVDDEDADDKSLSNPILNVGVVRLDGTFYQPLSSIGTKNVFLDYRQLMGGAY